MKSEIEKEEEMMGVGCLISIIAILLFFIIAAISHGVGANKPKEVIQTYEVTYINGLKEIVSYKVHEGTKAKIESFRGSYYLSFYYENINLFGFKYNEGDGCVAGIVSYKRVK